MSWLVVAKWLSSKGIRVQMELSRSEVSHLQSWTMKTSYGLHFFPHPQLEWRWQRQLCKSPVGESKPWSAWVPEWSHRCGIPVSHSSLILPQHCGGMFSSVQLLSRVWIIVTHELQHTRPPCPSPTPRVYPNSCSLSRGCRPTIFSFSCPQSFPASGSFPMSQLFASGGQSIGVSASTSVLLMNTQDWSPLGWTGWISLQSKGLSRVFSNTTVQKHQFFGAQLSL